MIHFYDGQIRRYITQIIRLMSNFSYQTSDGTLKQIPVLYGDMTRQVASIINENSENKMPTVPRMAVYITGLEMDRTRTSDSSFVSKVNIRERAYDSDGNEYLNTQGKNYTVERLMPTPYTLTVDVDIWSSNTDQKLQILEQILMLFNPSFELQTTDNYVDWTSLTVLNLERQDFSNRSIPVGTESEIDIAKLVFTTPIWISAPAKVKRLGVITNIITSVFNEATGSIDLSMSNAEILAGSNNIKTREFTSNSDDPEVNISVNRALDTQTNDSIAIATSYLDLGVYIEGNKALIIDKKSIGTFSWRSLFDAYPGCYNAGVSQIRLLKNDGTYIVGFVTINSLNENEIFVNWDEDTLPSSTVLEGPAREPNSWSSLDFIIDPSRWNPTQEKNIGLRLLLLGDINNSLSVGDSSYDGPDAWKNLDNSDFVASENDIVEWDGTRWHIIFDASTNNDPIFISNLATGSQYKWTGEFWTKSYEGDYSVGQWQLLPNG